MLNIPLTTVLSEEGPGYGAAILAAVGCGAFPSVSDAASSLVQTGETICPDPDIAARYEQKYQQFRTLYPAIKGLL